MIFMWVLPSCVTNADVRSSGEGTIKFDSYEATVVKTRTCSYINSLNSQKHYTQADMKVLPDNTFP